MIAADAFEAWRIGSIKKPELHRYSEKCVRGSGATDNSGWLLPIRYRSPFNVTPVSGLSSDE